LISAQLELNILAFHHASVILQFLFWGGGGVDLSDHLAQTKRGSDCLSGDDSASEAKAPKRTAKELTSNLDG